jgi:hypothetical protein
MPVTDEFVREHAEILERHTCGFKIGEFLGSGAFGSTFATDDPKWVVKITKDVDEVFGSQRIMDLRAKGYEAVLFPGLVDLFYVGKVPELEDDAEDLYIVVREEVTPIEDSDVDHQIIWDLDECLYTIEERQAYSKIELSNAFLELNKHAPYLARAINELESFGHILTDLGTINVGVTHRARLGAPAGTIVMFDVSFNRYPKEVSNASVL